MLKLLCLISPYLAVALRESIWEWGSAGENVYLRTYQRIFCGRSWSKSSLALLIPAGWLELLSLTQQAIFVKRAGEERPIQMCGHIIKSLNLSMPDRTRLRGQIIKGFSLSEPISLAFLSPQAACRVPALRAVLRGGATAASVPTGLAGLLPLHTSRCVMVQAAQQLWWAQAVCVGAAVLCPVLICSNKPSLGCVFWRCLVAPLKC